MEEMLARMSSREFSSWMIFDETVEPIGDLRGDLQAAGISSVVANAFRDREKRREPYQPSDFQLRWGEQAEADDQTTDHLTKMRALAALTKGSGRRA